MNLVDYWEKLYNTDWYYMMSDDGQAFRRGQDSVRKAREIAQDRGGEYQALYDGFQSWCQRKGEQPEKPE